MDIFLTFLVFEVQKLKEQETTSDLVTLKKRALNDRLMLAERGFLDADGLQGRQWFKHLVSIFVFLRLFVFSYMYYHKRQLNKNKWICRQWFKHRLSIFVFS